MIAPDPQKDIMVKHKMGNIYTMTFRSFHSGLTEAHLRAALGKHKNRFVVKEIRTRRE